MRVAIVHDNPDTIRLFSDLIQDLGHELSWSEHYGAKAIAHCQDILPDLILIKLDLPDMHGVEVTRNIMEQTPTTVIVISKSVKNHPAKVFEAMSVGALDAFTEPADDNQESIQELKSKIQNIHKLHKSISRKQPIEKCQIKKDIPLIAIGASTGGPAALIKVLTRLPEKPDAVIVIIQHMDNQFSQGLVKWLDEQTKIKIEMASPKQIPKPGIAYLAGTNDHLILTKDGRFDYTADPKEYPYRPSIDVFFESAVTHWPNKIIGVLLTGMGRDGANGLLSLHNRGMYTIAQDEASCAVYGMPKAAARLNAAQEILHIDDIGQAITKALSKGQME